MKKILLTFLFFIYAVYASEFFGTSGTGTNYDSGNNNYVFGNGSATYTCPGSGQFNIVSLSAFCKNTGGGTGAFSMAVYSADGSTLMGYMTNKYILTDAQTTGEYRGMDTSIVQLSTLTGGDDYIISINVSTTNVQNRYVSGSSGVFKYNTGVSYYDDGWPSSITLSSNYTLEFEVRCEVEAATEPCTTATIASIKITDTVYNSGKWKNTVVGSYDSIKKFGTWPDSTALFSNGDSTAYKVKEPFFGICTLIVHSCAGAGLDSAFDTINFVSGLRLDKYFPDTGKVGDTVLLIGHGFKNQQDSSTITIKDSVPTIVFWHNDTIRLVVPNVDTGYVDSTIVYDGYVADTLFNAFRVLGDYVIPRCTLTITSAHGTVTKTPDSFYADSGNAIGLKVSPAMGYSFTGWTGDTTTASDTVYYVLHESKTITANFTLIYPPVKRVILSIGQSNDIGRDVGSGYTTTDTTQAFIWIDGDSCFRPLKDPVYGVGNGATKYPAFCNEYFKHNASDSLYFILTAKSGIGYGFPVDSGWNLRTSNAYVNMRKIVDSVYSKTSLRINNVFLTGGESDIIYSGDTGIYRASIDSTVKHIKADLQDTTLKFYFIKPWLDDSITRSHNLNITMTDYIKNTSNTYELDYMLWYEAYGSGNLHFNRTSMDTIGRKAANMFLYEPFDVAGNIYPQLSNMNFMVNFSDWVNCPDTIIDTKLPVFPDRKYYTILNNPHDSTSFFNKVSNNESFLKFQTVDSVTIKTTYNMTYDSTSNKTIWMKYKYKDASGGYQGLFQQYYSDQDYIAAWIFSASNGRNIYFYLTFNGNTHYCKTVAHPVDTSVSDLFLILDNGVPKIYLYNSSTSGEMSYATPGTKFDIREWNTHNKYFEIGKYGEYTFNGNMYAFGVVDSLIDTNYMKVLHNSGNKGIAINLYSNSDTTVLRRIELCTLTITRTAGGTISDSGAVIDTCGDSLAVVAVPDTGYTFTKWSVSGSVGILDSLNDTTKVFKTDFSTGGIVTAIFTRLRDTLYSNVNNWSLSRIPNSTDSIVIDTFTVGPDANHNYWISPNNIVLDTILQAYSLVINRPFTKNFNQNTKIIKTTSNQIFNHTGNLVLNGNDTMTGPGIFQISNTGTKNCSTAIIVPKGNTTFKGSVKLSRVRFINSHTYKFKPRDTFELKNQTAIDFNGLDTLHRAVYRSDTTGRNYFIKLRSRLSPVSTDIKDIYVIGDTLNCRDTTNKNSGNNKGFYKKWGRIIIGF